MSDSDSVHPEVLARVHAVISACRACDGPLLPVLHAVQEALGYIPFNAITEIARMLDRSRAEVWGVVSYYKHFRTEAPGRCLVAICRAESCRTMGSEALLAEARRRLGCSEHQPTARDGSATVEPAYCLGLCACSPALTVNGRPYARVTPERLARLLDRLPTACP